ncbi:MAG: pentapeptide repeat-containing protein [Chloroflexota bacterium]
MTMSTLDKRLDESREARDQFWQGFTLERFGTVTSLIALAVLFGGLFLIYGNIPNLKTLATDFYANISSELASIVITVLIVDRLNRQREKRDQVEVQERLDEQELNRLKALLGSDERVVTKIAIAELRARDWLKGMLRNTDFNGVNLEGENLSSVNLRGSKLSRANLQEARLYNMNLENCNFYKANLSGADISHTNLSRAYLHKSNVANASASRTDFRGTILWSANLINVRDLEYAYFDETTVLPDARPLYDDNGSLMTDENDMFLYDSYWTPDTDMTRYSNPDHPEFWQPSWVKEAIDD